jgi:hypothetical protein
MLPATSRRDCQTAVNEGEGAWPSRPELDSFGWVAGSRLSQALGTDYHSFAVVWCRSALGCGLVYGTGGWSGRLAPAPAPSSAPAPSLWSGDAVAPSPDRRPPALAQVLLIRSLHSATTAPLDTVHYTVSRFCSFGGTDTERLGISLILASSAAAHAARLSPSDFCNHTVRSQHLQPQPRRVARALCTQHPVPLSLSLFTALASAFLCFAFLSLALLSGSSARDRSLWIPSEHFPRTARGRLPARRPSCSQQRCCLGATVYADDMYTRQNNQHPVAASHTQPRSGVTSLPPLSSPMDHQNMATLPPAQAQQVQQVQQVYGGVDGHLKPFQGHKGGRMYRYV